MRFKGTVVHAVIVAALLLATAATAIVVARQGNEQRALKDRARALALRNSTAAVASQMTDKVKDLAADLEFSVPGRRRAEFERIGKMSLATPGISILRLIMRVPGDQRAAYEKKLGRTILGRDFGRMPDRSEYMVIDDTVSHMAIRPIEGIDVLSEPVRARAIKASLANGRPVATGPLLLLSGEPGSVLFVPIYRTGAPVRTARQRRDAAIGVVSAGLRTGAIVSAVRDLSPGIGQFQITDDGSLLAATADYSHPSGVHQRVPFADRTWIVGTDHTAGNSAQSIIAVTLGGLIITALVAIALAQMRRRELYASEMVEERTGELNAANALLTENARFFELSRDLVCTAGFDGKLITVNDAWTELLGWTRHELIEISLWEKCHPDDATAIADSFGDLIHGGSIVDVSFRLPAKDGSWRWLEWSANGVPERGLIYASARDVTERHRLEEQLWIEHAQMKSAQEIASLGSWNVDLETGEMQWSDNLFELLGIEQPDEPLTIEHWLAILPDADRDRAMKLLTDTLRDGGVFEFEFSRRLADAHGRPVHLLTRGFAERNAQDRTVRLVGTVADITERHLYEEGLRFVADHDPMTGIANRRQFDSVLKRHVIAARRYGPDGAVLMIDVDDLKQVNDTIGHAAGDALIRSVADALNNRLRGTDLCARIGGDEFAVLLPRATRAEAEATARSLHEAISVPSAELLEKGIKTVTASIGIVMIVDAPGADADELVDLADEAMYQAKRTATSSIRTYKPAGEQATSPA